MADHDPTSTAAATGADKPKKKKSTPATNGTALAAVGVVDQPAAATPARSPIAEQLHATGDTIRAEAQRKASELGDEFGRLTTQAGDKAKELATKGKSKAAESLESLATLIGDSSTQVDDKLGKQYGDFARSAAQTVSGLAGSLDEKDFEELMTEAREFVKKSPAVAIGSAAVVGFLLARLLRSSK